MAEVNVLEQSKPMVIEVELDEPFSVHINGKLIANHESQDEAFDLWHRLRQGGRTMALQALAAI